MKTTKERKLEMRLALARDKNKRLLAKALGKTTKINPKYKPFMLPYMK